MHIAYISTLITEPWGGSEELWHQSAQEALVQGHKVSVFVTRWPILPKKLKSLQDKGARIYYRSKKLTFWKRIFSKTGLKLSRLSPFYPLVQIKPDIIIVTDGSTYYTANNTDLSTILLQYYKSRYCIISQANAHLHLPHDRTRALLLFRNALKVFFVSSNNRDLCYHQLASSLSNSVVIQNPLLTSDSSFYPLAETGEVIHCALVGRFSIPEKGQDILISMMNDSEWLNSRVILHLYGSGCDESYLKDLIKYYNVPHVVKIEGYESDIKKIWNKCQCLLMCSQIEGTPLTLLEAMFAGRICIVTRVGGNDEWIQDGENGYLVDFPSKESFSTKLKIAIQSRNEWARISQAAHDSIKAKIDLNPGITLLNQIVSINKS